MKTQGVKSHGRQFKQCSEGNFVAFNTFNKKEKREEWPFIDKVRFPINFF